METPFEIGIKKAGFRKFSGARRNNQPDEKRETAGIRQNGYQSAGIQISIT